MTQQALVVGFGAIGHYIAWILVKNGFKVAVQLRRDSESAENPRAEAIEVSEGIRELFFVEKPDPTALYQLCIVCVKAYDLERAVQGFPSSQWPFGLAQPPHHVVVIANGAIAPLVQAYGSREGKTKWYLGLSTIGVSWDGCFKVRSRQGQLVVGPVFGNHSSRVSDGIPVDTLPQEFPQLFRPSHSSIPVKAGGEPPSDQTRDQTRWLWTDSMRSAYGLKWITNTTLNTLCAAFRYSSNQQALSDEARLRSVFDEVYRLYLEVIDPELSAPLSAAEAYGELIKVIGLTATNENSMARDRRQGRTLEHGFLAGLIHKSPHPQISYPQLYKLDQELQGGASL